MPNLFGLGLDIDALFDQLSPERVCSTVSLREPGSKVRSKTPHHVERELLLRTVAERRRLKLRTCPHSHQE